jgi:hypothetical protein
MRWVCAMNPSQPTLNRNGKVVPYTTKRENSAHSKRAVLLRGLCGEMPWVMELVTILRSRRIQPPRSSRLAAT